MYTRGALTMSTSSTSLWPLPNSAGPEETAGDAPSAINQASAPTMSDAARVKMFLIIQLFFLFITPFCGGFHFALWSMMDTALMIQAIGITALVVVLDQEWMRVYAFRIAVLFYVSSIMAMGIAVLVSGVVGWSGVFS
jgi:hypothetical protein